MGRLMGSSNSNNYGEQIFINKASEYLDDTNIIYWNRQLFGKEFDVCILMPEKGILVVELKGWREENILRIENNDSVIIQTNDGEVSASPQKQARGYRFSIERHIRQNIGKFPLVYQMVCLPQVSKAFFKSHRLDVVMEEKFTILKEDLKDNTSFFNKLDQALREVCHWNRDPFDRRTMLEVRNLFETDINVDEDGESEIEKELASSYHRHDYSRFYYFNEFDQMSGNTINDMVAQYLHGCKLYCVFSKKAQMLAVIKALDTALTQRGLVRNRDNIEIAFDEQKSHTPLAESVGDMFMGFHCSMSVLSAPFDKNTTSFAIPNGSYSSAQKRILEKLSEQSQFNFEQYQVEHATPEKNIVIRAGAGTGKTYTMISRIGFICYTQNVPLQKMADRIVMITFTNEAADQMEEKLKAYFKNCYLVTSKPDYLQMISQIDHMQISTIHSYAKNLIAQMGTSFGYGIDLSITSSEFYRRKKISDLLDAYIYQKEMEQGKNYTAIFNYKRRFPLAYADGLPSLVPEAYRAKADEKEQNDNKILAVALRYKIYTDIPVLFITDDRSLSNKASGEGLDVWTSKDFLAPPETSFDDESPTAPGTHAPIPELEAQIAEVTAAETPALESSEEERLDAEAAETKRQAKAKEEYLAQKISTKLLHLEASQISLLQNNGIKTIADFMAQTENSFASMKVKKGIPFTARFLKEQETIRCKLENL